MIIKKILNNNVVLSTNEQHSEIVLMGKGLAFQKKVGDKVDEKIVNKTYELNNPVTVSKFQDLLETIPVEYLSVAYDIVEKVEKKLDLRLKESLLFSLTDHIHSAILRLEEGIQLKNVLLWDIKRFFPQEFSLGMDALDKIQESLGYKLDENEAGFIAMHFVNSRLGSESDNASEITEIMQEITNIMKYFFKVEFDEQSIYFQRFLTHIQFFAHRLVTHTSYESQSEEDLLDVVIIKYPNEYQCVGKINEFLLKTRNYIVSPEEKLYLTIHIVKCLSTSVRH